MRLSKYALCLASVLLGLNAAAQTPPLTTSFSGKGTYQHEGRTVEASIRGGDQKLRLDMSPEALGMSQGAALIIDHQTGKVISFPTGDVPPNLRFAMIMPASPAPVTSEFAAPSGTRTVAGEVCTNYSFMEQTETGELTEYMSCLTDDGIWLASQTRDGERLFEMTEFTRAPQSPVLFSPPPGYQEMSLQDLQNMGMGAGMPVDGTDMMPGAMAENEEPGFLERQAENAKQQTEYQLGDRIERERSEVVGKVLGSIFGN